jgi:hypothetical protein
MDEVEKIKALKKEQKGGGCLIIALLAMAGLGWLLFASVFFANDTPHPEPQIKYIPVQAEQYQPLIHQRQTAIVIVADNRTVMRVGYEYHNNYEVVTVWECGYQQAICQWYTPARVPVGRQLYAVVEYSDGVTLSYPFGTTEDYLEIDGMNRVRREFLP